MKRYIKEVIMIGGVILAITFILLCVGFKGYATTTYNLPDGTTYIKEGVEYDAIEILQDNKLIQVYGTISNPKEGLMSFFASMAILSPLFATFAIFIITEQERGHNLLKDKTE